MAGFGRVFRTKKVILSDRQLRNAIIQIYYNSKDISGKDDGVGKKFKEISNGTKLQAITLIYFENTSTEKLHGTSAPLKTKFRDFLLNHTQAAEASKDPARTPKEPAKDPVG